MGATLCQLLADLLLCSSHTRHLATTTSPGSQQPCKSSHPHVTDGGTEAQRNKVTCSRPQREELAGHAFPTSLGRPRGRSWLCWFPGESFADVHEGSSGRFACRGLPRKGPLNPWSLVSPSASRAGLSGDWGSRLLAVSVGFHVSELPERRPSP